MSLLVDDQPQNFVDELDGLVDDWLEEGEPTADIVEALVAKIRELEGDERDDRTD